MKSLIDPLVAASLMILQQACMAFESYQATGCDCPLCEVDRNLGTGVAVDWVDADADLILQICRERNLVTLEAY